MASKWGSTLHLFPYSCQKGVDSSILLCLQNVMSENLQQLLAGVQSCTKLLSVETNHPLDSIIEYVWGYYVIKEYLLFILEYINVEELLQVQREYHIVGNFWGRKLLQILQFCGYLQKFCPRNLEVWHPLAQQKWAICKSFLCENRIFTNLWKFSLSKISHCMILYEKHFI